MVEKSDYATRLREIKVRLEEAQLQNTNLEEELKIHQQVQAKLKELAAELNAKSSR